MEVAFDAPVVSLYEMTATTLDARASGRENNFDVLGSLGATLVLASHSFVVTGADEPRSVTGRWARFGVEVFFAISGFLIAASWLAGRACAVRVGAACASCPPWR